MLQTPDIHQVTDPSTRALYYDRGSEIYYQYRDGAWVERNQSWVQKEVLDTKAYIDMPNLTYFTFLHPRNFTIGLKISF